MYVQQHSHSRAIGAILGRLSYKLHTIVLHLERCFKVCNEAITRMSVHGALLFNHYACQWHQHNITYSSISLEFKESSLPLYAYSLQMYSNGFILMFGLLNESV